MRRVHHLVAAGLLLASSCTTVGPPYQPEAVGRGGGYADQRLRGDGYRITFTARRGTPVASVDRLARRRAAEFTLALGFRGFAVLGRKVTREIYVLPGGERTRATYGGDYRGWRRFWRFYCLGNGLTHCDEDPLWPSGGRSQRRIEVAYDIRPTNEVGGSAIDARALLDALSG